MAATASSSAASASSSGGGRSNPAAAAAGASAACACPICLEAFKEAYLDTCLHSFCYKCISQWVNIVARKHEEPLSSVRCPLCMTENVSMVHAFDGELFQRHYIQEDPRKRHLSDAHELISQFYIWGALPKLLL